MFANHTNEGDQQCISRLTKQLTIGTGFAYNGLLLTSEATLTRVSGWPAGQVTFGLVKLRPDSDLATVMEELTNLGSGEVDEKKTLND